ncbi:MAG: cation transporter [Elusimicrobiota bacterium]
MNALTIAALLVALAYPSGCAPPGQRSTLLAESDASRLPRYSIGRLKALREGRYKCTVTGVLCNACTRAIVEALERVEGVSDAEFDFEEGVLWITIAENGIVKTGKVLRALRLAARRVNLDTRYEITEIRYVR